MKDTYGQTYENVKTTLAGAKKTVSDALGLSSGGGGNFWAGGIGGLIMGVLGFLLGGGGFMGILLAAVLSLIGFAGGDLIANGKGGMVGQMLGLKAPEGDNARACTQRGINETPS